MDENKKNFDDKSIKVLRTYTSDMADAIKTNEASVIKIALAEKTKREQEAIYEKAEGTGFSKTILVIGGIILILAAIGGSYYLIQKKKEKETPPPIVTSIETFIAYDSYTNVDVTNATNVSELSEIIKKIPQTNSGLIKALFLIRKTNGVSEILTTKDFLSLIRVTAPGAFTRSLADKYLIGRYSNQKSVNEEATIFLIFQTNDYNQTYASLLEWEKTMLRDLFTLFNININGVDNSLFEKQWKDIIINNRDARVLYGENGEGILYYLFVNKNNFIITNNIEAMREVVSRLIIKNTKPL